MQAVSCAQCGGPLRAGKRYCSRRCQGDAERKVRTCEHCGGPRFQRGSGHRFCSRECAALASRGRTLPAEQREKIAESNRRTKALRRTPSLGPRLETRLCEVCGAEFQCRPHLKQRACSIACRPRLTREPYPREGRRRLSERYRGAGNPAWKGGVSQRPENQRNRTGADYRDWRQAVFQRDGYSCVKCGARGHRRTPLVAHHIQPWADFPELRFDVENGETLCHPCHRIAHGWLGEPQRRSDQLRLAA